MNPRKNHFKSGAMPQPDVRSRRDRDDSQHDVRESNSRSGVHDNSSQQNDSPGDTRRSRPFYNNDRKRFRSPSPGSTRKYANSRDESGNELRERVSFSNNDRNNNRFRRNNDRDSSFRYESDRSRSTSNYRWNNNNNKNSERPYNRPSNRGNFDSRNDSRFRRDSRPGPNGKTDYAPNSKYSRPRSPSESSTNATLPEKNPYKSRNIDTDVHKDSGPLRPNSNRNSTKSDVLKSEVESNAPYTKVLPDDRNKIKIRLGKGIKDSSMQGSDNTSNSQNDSNSNSKSVINRREDSIDNPSTVPNLSGGPDDSKSVSEDKSEESENKGSYRRDFTRSNDRERGRDWDSGRWSSRDFNRPNHRFSHRDWNNKDRRYGNDRDKKGFNDSNRKHYSEFSNSNRYQKDRPDYRSRNFRHASRSLSRSPIAEDKLSENDQVSEMSEPKEESFEKGSFVKPPLPYGIIEYMSESIYRKTSQIGEGTYGKVYKAFNINTNQLVALKKLRMESEKDGFPFTAVREIKLLQTLRHPNIVSLIEMMVEKSQVYMVFEYLDHDLSGILLHPTLKFSEGNVKYLFRQIVDGLAYMHSRGILHRDIKGSNILLGKDGVVKIADLGLARSINLLNSAAHYTNRVITLWYRPPELLLGATNYDGAVDIWGIGCILAEFFVKKAILQSKDYIGQLKVIYSLFGTPIENGWPEATSLPWYPLMPPKVPSKSQFKEKYTGIIPEQALKVIEKMMILNPKNRCTAIELLKDEYFTSGPVSERPVQLESVTEEWHDFEAKYRRRKKAAQKQQQHQQQQHQQQQQQQQTVGKESRNNQFRNSEAGDFSQEVVNETTKAVAETSINTPTTRYISSQDDSKSASLKKVS